VIACAAVAVLAVVIFVVVLMNGGFGGQGEVTEVPYLIGMTQAELGDLDVSIKLGPGAYNEQYAKDQIYDQNPKPGTKIAKGGMIRLFIPPHLAYGERGAGPIAPNSVIIFEIEVLDIVAE
jgi:beta-lactam-binding protein with PASTA domain